jgi:hypothetical protein
MLNERTQASVRALMIVRVASALIRLGLLKCGQLDARD